MKNKSNYKYIGIILLAAILIAVIFNYFYPNGIPYLQTEEKFQWADNTQFSDTTINKTPQEFFSELPPAKTHYLSESKQKEPKSKIQLINLTQTHRLFSSDTVIFIDARDKWDFSEGHIPGSLNIPHYNFDKNNIILNNVPKQKTVVIYCGGDDCDASLSLAKELQKLQYTTLFVFSGGWVEWITSGYEIEKGKS